MADVLRVEFEQYVWITSRDVLRVQSTYFQGYCPSINDESGIWQPTPLLESLVTSDLHIRILDWICQPPQKPNESTPEYHARVLSYDFIDLKKSTHELLFAQDNNIGITVGVPLHHVSNGSLNLARNGIMHGSTQSKIAFIDDDMQSPFNDWERLITLLRRWDLRVLESKVVHWMYQHAWQYMKVTDLLSLETYFGSTCPVNGFIAKTMSILLVREMQPATWKSRKGVLFFHNITTPYGLQYPALERSPSWQHVKDEFFRLVLTEGIHHLPVEQIYAKFALPVIHHRPSTSSTSSWDELL